MIVIGKLELKLKTKKKIRLDYFSKINSKTTTKILFLSLKTFY